MGTLKEILPKRSKRTNKIVDKMQQNIHQAQCSLGMVFSIESSTKKLYTKCLFFLSQNKSVDECDAANQLEKRKTSSVLYVVRSEKKNVT